jgi:SpoVK/Ycf46/Vps4 family AAA+-type ATPase
MSNFSRALKRLMLRQPLTLIAAVDQLQPITWNPEAFEKLILPGDEKQLAWEFVEAKSLASQGDEFDDFIPDKGRGLLILLFGPPGVGKTFTAEAVAEKARVPLYTMSAADIGTNPQDVERELERALSLCRMWNAMLLIDEADVFLAARSSDSIARNELVSIFLRMLEYYQGTLFLTTNCIASVDAAFQSRIDLFLPYYDLTNTARREVWKNFVERAGSDKFDVTDEWLDKLSYLRLNGSEIKNLIKSAQLLSLKNGNKVSIDLVYLLAEKRVQSLKVVGESPQ